MAVNVRKIFGPGDPVIRQNVLSLADSPTLKPSVFEKVAQSRGVQEKNHVKCLTFRDKQQQRFSSCPKTGLRLMLLSTFMLGPGHLRQKQKPNAVSTRYPVVVSVKVVNLVILGAEGAKY